MKSDLLLKLADMLDADADNEKGMKFDITNVGIFVGSSQERDTWQPGLNCNTVGCAMGLAMMSGEFPDLSFKHYYEGSDDLVPMYGGQRTCYDDAAAYVFDIGLNTARYLFSPAYYPPGLRTEAEGERAVAARIRLLVKNGRLTSADLKLVGEL